MSASILIVEDSAFNAQLMQVLLRREGFHVTVAESAEAALRMLDEGFALDLILMDVQLPGMSGLELTRLLKASPAWGGLRIIALTANNSPEERKQAAEAGCDGFIAKPVDPPKFASRVRLWLSTETVPTGKNPAIEFGQIREEFLVTGEKESAELLRAVEEKGDCPGGTARVLHRWIGCGETAGVPAITLHARRLQNLIASSDHEYAAVLSEARKLHQMFEAALREARQQS